MRVVLAVIFLVFVSCTNNSKVLAEKDLRILLEDDLRVICEDIDSSLLLDKPYFKIDTMTWFEKSKYSCNAVVYYYFLKDESYRIERKYRLVSEMQKWDRYYNEYKLIQD